MSGTTDTGPRVRAYLAVDGGGTRTRAVIVDDAGRHLGSGVAAGCNHRVVGAQRALARVRGAVVAASRQAGYAPPFTGAWLGLAGIDGTEDADWIRAHLAPLAADPRVTNDAELVLAGLGVPGLALIAGTGSIAIGVDQTGRLVRVGGWGHLIGDEGSAFDIGRRALQVAARMADGRAPRGALLDRVCSYFGVACGGGLIERVYARSAKTTIAALASEVLRAAHAGDRDARAIARAAAGDLTATAVAVVRLLDVDEPVAVALSGGVLVADRWYRGAVSRRLRGRVRVGLVRVVAEPALLAARALAGDGPPEASGAASAGLPGPATPDRIGR